ncbi:MAG: vWA domain-containing protein [Nannocystaceae bacterium]
MPSRWHFRRPLFNTILGADVSTFCLTLAVASCTPKGDRYENMPANDDGVAAGGSDEATEEDGSVEPSVTEKYDIGEEAGENDTENGSDIDVPSKKIDLLFVIDNSGSMGEEQANLARNFPNFDSATPRP